MDAKNALTSRPIRAWFGNGRECHDATDLTPLDLKDAFKDFSSDITGAFLSHFQPLKRRS
jgi:hypothetical protein